MKHKLLPLLIAGLSIGFGEAALAGVPTVYGKINVSLQKNDYEQITAGAIADERDNWRLDSNASRIGVKGDYDITKSLKAVYKLEYEVAVDSGLNSNGREFSARNIAGGLQGSWGTILFGRHDTPLKLIQEKVDRFNDLQLADITNYLVGENRRDNLLLYTSPSFSGFALTLAAAPGEQSGASSTQDDNDGLFDTTSIALSYGLGTNLYLGLAHERNIAPNSDLSNPITATTRGNSADITRFVVDYTIAKVVKVGALYQTAEQHNSDNVLPNISSAIGQFSNGNSGSTLTSGIKEQDGWIVNGEWSVTPEWVVKAQYGQSKSTPVNAALSDVDSKLIALGVDYKLDKNSRIYTYYAALETEGDASVSSKSPVDKTFAVGYELNF